MTFVLEVKAVAIISCLPHPRYLGCAVVLRRHLWRKRPKR